MADSLGLPETATYIIIVCYQFIISHIDMREVLWDIFFSKKYCKFVLENVLEGLGKYVKFKLHK